MIKGDNNIDLPVGSVIADRYSLMTHLGKGGYGSVYQAYDQLLKRDVAVKIFFNDSETLFNEINMLKDIKHTGLPYVNDICRISQNYTAIVMEFIHGDTLMSIVEKEGAFSLVRTLTVIEQLCNILSYLHQRKPQIIHGDIKPNNIMISSENDVSLIDYNLAQCSTEYKLPLGRTDGYSPPEFYMPEEWNNRQFTVNVTSVAYPHSCFDIDFPLALKQGCSGDSLSLFYTQSVENMNYHFHCNSLVSVRSDIYSLGATIFYMATGKHPWPANIINNEIDTLHPILKNIIQRCMAMNPYNRFNSVRDILTYLK